MPYELTGPDFDELQARLQKTYPWIGPKGTRHFAKAFNSAFESYGNEGQAFAVAYGALNKARYAKAPSDTIGSTHQALGQWQTDPELSPAGPVPFRQCPTCVDPEQESLERRIRNRMGVEWLASHAPNLDRYQDWLKPGGAYSNMTDWQLSQASIDEGLSPETLGTLKHLLYAQGPAWWDADPQWAGGGRGCASFGASLSTGGKALTWSLVIGGILGAAWAIRRM